MKYLSRKDIEAIGERVTKAYFRLPDLTGKTVYKITSAKERKRIGIQNTEHHILSGKRLMWVAFCLKIIRH